MSPLDRPGGQRSRSHQPGHTGREATLRGRPRKTGGNSDMAQVNTIRGPVDSSELGPTLMHEHVFILQPDLLQNYPDPWNEEERVSDAIEKLRRLSALGIKTD